MKLTKKQIKAVYNYLVSIQQPTTAKQFKKDWSKKKSITIISCGVDGFRQHPLELKEKIRELTEPKVVFTYHEEDQPGKENTITKND